MKGVIRVISYLAIIVGFAFFLNRKLSLHISFLDITSWNTLYVFLGAVVVGFVGLYFTRD